MGDGTLTMRRSGLALVPKEIEIPAVEAEAAPIQSRKSEVLTRGNVTTGPVETSYPLVPPSREYTKSSNWLTDVAMPEMSGNAYKLFNFIYRQTLFSKNEKDRIEGKEFSNLELIRGTGLGSFSTVQDAISELEGAPTKKKGNAKGRVYIIVTKRGGWDRVHYQVNLKMRSDATENVAINAKKNQDRKNNNLSPGQGYRYRKCSVIATETVVGIATETVDMIKKEEKKERKKTQE